MRRFYLTLLVGLFLLGGTARAAEPDPLPNEIPADAERAGPFGFGKREGAQYYYYNKGQPHDMEKPIAIETYRDVVGEKDLGGYLASRVFYRGNRQQHGLTRSWHKNGQLAKETPYRDGLMDGRCREWSNEGVLLADYLMRAGTGARAVYHPSGFVASEEELVANESVGLSNTGYPGGGLKGCYRAAVYLPAGYWNGLSVQFFPDGTVSSVMLPAGSRINFKADGSLANVEWWTRGDLNSHQMTEAAFAAAVEADPSQGPYFSDPLHYKTLVSEEYWAQVRKFQRARPVRIPLELDDFGMPLPVGPAPFADESYLSYTVPKEAMRRDTSSKTDLIRSYFLPATEHAAEIELGHEVRRNDVMVERVLYAEGRLHGIQRKWHGNGRLAEESPYKNGVMHGRFRRWTEAGELIADYRMTEGSGREVIFFPNGVLAEEQEYVQGLKDGPYSGAYPSGALKYCGRFSRDDTLGVRCEFFEGGELARISFASGPSVRFRVDGDIASIEWFLNHERVSHDEYAKAAAGDPTLPPLVSSAQSYREWVPLEFRKLWKKYYLAQRALMPLTLDAGGAPVLKEEDYLSWSIPRGAKDQGPPRNGSYYDLPWGAEKISTYLLPWQAMSRREVVGFDIEFAGRQQILMRDGRRHGVQRKWHSNGQLAEESPYRRGLMHGRFRRWSPEGALIADYQMVDGNGREVIYRLSGWIESEREYRDNQTEGLHCDAYPNGKLRYCGWTKRESSWKFHEISCEYYESGPFRALYVEGGPTLEFKPDGSLATVKWRLDGRDVTEQEFARYTADSRGGGPPYFSDPLKYKELIPEKFAAVKRRYDQARQVKIPLELDAQGVPMLAAASR